MDNENLNNESQETLESELNTENLDTENTENLDTEESIETTETEEDKKDMVPLRSHLQIKAENRALKKQIASIKDAQYEESVKRKKQETFQTWKDKGFDDATAELMSNQIADIYSEFASLDKARNQNYLDLEIEDLKGTDFYNDIDSYKSQIVETISKAKKAGIDMSVKQAYASVVDMDAKFKQATTKTEVKNRLNNRGNSSANVDTSSSSTTKDIYNLDENDKRALAQLQIMQPTRGWTAKKYFETVKKTE